MPEGDSAVRAATRLREVLVGRTLTAVDGVPAVRRRAASLVGRTVEGVRSRGKHVLIDVEGGLTIHVWLGMPGRWRFGRAGHEGERPGGPDDPGAVRLSLVTEGDRVTCFAAPTVEVDRSRVIDARLDRLGPDLLGDGFDVDEVVRRAALVPGDVTVSDLLLDQRVLAGIGNEYKSEVLFLERIHPATPVSSLDPADVARLVGRALRIMAPNARRSGRRNTTGLAGRGRETWVYGRAGRPCRRCRTAVVEAWLGERAPRITYWCPTCQPEPGRG